MKGPTLLLLALAAAVPLSSRAQGCSDAGVCSVGPLGQPAPLPADSTDDGPLHAARLTYSFAVGEQNVTIMQVRPELRFGLTRRLSIQAQVPYVSTSGDLGQVNGIGDAVVSASYIFISKEPRELSGTLGLRLPTGTTNHTVVPDKGPGNTTLDARAYALPMPYQTGLGTLDLLLGAQYRLGRWTTALAYQHVLDQGNENMFTRAAWAFSPEAQGYFESYQLHRAGDLIARVQYARTFGALTVQPGLLAIQHLQDDTFLAPTNAMAETGEARTRIEGSQGLTLNLTADLRYTFNDRWSAEATMGTPLVTREARPDGLTRSLVTGVSVRYRF